MALWITVNLMKDLYFDDISDGETKWDWMIQQMIQCVEAEAIDYLSDDDITVAADLPVALTRPIMKQVAYEFRRRKDVGLSSQTFNDQSINKWEMGEWIESVETALDRHRHMELG